MPHNVQKADELQEQVKKLETRIKKLEKERIKEIKIKDELSGYDTDISEKKTQKGRIITISIKERC